MNDFRAIARILSAIRVSEEKTSFDPALIDPSVLKVTAECRDTLTLKLSKAGYIDGLFVIDSIDNLDRPRILWEKSRPSVTLAGLEYAQTCEPLRQALGEVKSASLAIAAQVAAAGASSLL